MLGCWFCKLPAIMHSCDVKKCVSIPRICLTVPSAGLSVIKSVNIQPTCFSHRSENGNKLWEQEARWLWFVYLFKSQCSCKFINFLTVFIVQKFYGVPIAFLWWFVDSSNESSNSYWQKRKMAMKELLRFWNVKRCHTQRYIVVHFVRAI